MRPNRATPWRRELGQRAGQDVADDAQGGLALVVLALQVEEHGEIGQNRIFGRPGSWLHAEKMILEWFSAQRIQARVDPGNVGVEPPAIEFIEIGQDSPGNLPEPEDGAERSRFRTRSPAPGPMISASSPAAERRIASI